MSTHPEEKTVHPGGGQQPMAGGEPWETGDGTFAELHGSPYEQGRMQGRIAAANIAANVQITRQVAAELGGGRGTGTPPRLPGCLPTTTAIPSDHCAGTPPAAAGTAPPIRSSSTSTPRGSLL